MSSTPQDLPTLTDDERRAHGLIAGISQDVARGPITLTQAERAAVVYGLQELDAYRQRDREPNVPRPFPGVSAATAVRAAMSAHGLRVPADAPPGPAPAPSWEAGVYGVEQRIRHLAAEAHVVDGYDSEVLLDYARELATLTRVLPLLEARAGDSPTSAGEAALADVLTEARAVVATIARNGITGDHLTGRLEPLRDAVRGLDRALDNLPPAR